MPPKSKRKIFGFTSLLKPFLMVALSAVLAVFVFKIYLPLGKYLKEKEVTPQLMESLVFDRNPILKTYQGRTNLLVLGIPGGDYDGSRLTDSIMVVSLDWQKKDGIFLSVPRDIYLESLKDKINSAYYYGEMKKPGGGFPLAKAAVEEVIGQPVHYGMAIDFSGFKKIVDLVGGLEVNVETTFTDNNYPVAGKENDPCGGDPKLACRYEKLHFEKGTVQMDGERVLKFVRSRQAEGEEGTDFARSRRQQQVIMSFKNKVLNGSFIFSEIRNWKVFLGTYEETMNTDMKLVEQISFGKFFLSVPNKNIRKLALDNGNDYKGKRGYLLNPPLNKYNKEWILIPRTGDFKEIKAYIDCQFKDLACTLQP